MGRPAARGLSGARGRPSASFVRRRRDYRGRIVVLVFLARFPSQGPDDDDENKKDDDVSHLHDKSLPPV